MESNRDKKRNLIIDTALQLFIKNGYQYTKIIDIAKAAGMGKGTFYDYFSNKESLLLEILKNRVYKDYIAPKDFSNRGVNTYERLREFLQFNKAFFTKYGSGFFHFHKYLLQNDREFSSEIIKTIHSIALNQYITVYDIIKKGIEEGELNNVSPALAACTFVPALGVYVSLSINGIDFANEFIEKVTLEKRELDEIKTEIEAWTDEDFLNFIMKGLQC